LTASIGFDRAGVADGDNGAVDRGELSIVGVWSFGHGMEEGG
jgi:hypothetical protein